MRSTREDVETILGELDDILVAKILAVGASKTELHEAALAAVRDFELGEPVESGANPRVDALSAIIEEVLKDDEEELTSPGGFDPAREEERDDRR